MAQFTFSVVGSSHSFEPLISELPNAMAACAEAVRYAARVMADSPMFLIGDQDWTIEATDHTGLVLLSVIVSTTKSPAVTRS